MAHLALNLHKQWFDLIKKGRKKIEYRARSEYWAKRIEGKKYDEIHFRNGYRKNAPFMRVKCTKITKTKTEYRIHLGRILERRNIGRRAQSV